MRCNITVQARTRDLSTNDGRIKRDVDLLLYIINNINSVYLIYYKFIVNPFVTISLRLKNKHDFNIIPIPRLRLHSSS